MTDLKLYISPGSAPSRATLFMWNRLLDRLEVNHNCEVYAIDLQAGEHRSEEFLKLNPTHTVPTLAVDGHGAWESRALMAYLCELAGGHAANPWQPEHRAELNRLLAWDLGTFYKAVGAWVYPQVFQGQTAEEIAGTVTPVLEAVAFLEGYQLGDDRDFLLGDVWTIADVSIAFGMTMLELVDEDLLADFPRINAWRERMAALPGWAEVNEPFEQWKASMRGATPAETAAEMEAETEAPAPETALAENDTVEEAQADSTDG